MKTNTLTPELLDQMDVYWRAANYLSVGQIYLYDNPLLKRPLTLADVKHMLLGHRGQHRATRLRQRMARVDCGRNAGRLRQRPRPLAFLRR